MAEEEKGTVPVWFHNFAIANEKAHGDLAQAISGVNSDLGQAIAGLKGEFHSIKSLGKAVFGVVCVGLIAGFVALLKYMIGF